MRLSFDFSVRDATKVFFGLIFLDLCLVSIFAAAILLGSPSWRILFNLDREGNIPAWFSSVQLFLTGMIVLLRSREIDPGHSPSRLFFLAVGTGFIFLSADEAASIHETIGRALIHVEWMPRFKGGHGIWIFVYALIGLILLLACFRRLAAIWNRYRHATSIMAMGLGFALLGAVGLEAISYQFLRSGSTPLLYLVEVALEEFLEMSGASIMLYGALLLLLEDSRAEN